MFPDLIQIQSIYIFHKTFVQALNAQITRLLSTRIFWLLIRFFWIHLNFAVNLMFFNQFFVWKSCKFCPRFDELLKISINQYIDNTVISILIFWGAKSVRYWWNQHSWNYYSTNNKHGIECQSLCKIL